MKSSPKSVAEWLQCSPSLGGLARRSRIHEQLLQRIRQTLPESLACHCLACVLDARGKLILYVTAPTWASRLRYYQPQILAALQAEFPIRRLQVRVLLAETAVQRPALSAKFPSPAVISQLEQALSAMPEPALRHALERLLDTLRREAGFSRQGVQG